MADAAVPVVAAVPVAAAVPMVAAVVVAAAEAAEVEGAEAAFAADTGMMGSRDQHQLQRYRRLRDEESLRGPDDFLESIGQQRAGHVPYGNLSKTAQRNYMASLQDNEEDEAATRAHIYSPGERSYVDNNTPIINQLSNSRRNAIIDYNLNHSDTIAVWNDIHHGSDEVEEPHYWPVDDKL